ncbi:MAG: NAD(P)/FAD-dependent oxidoreductase [Candidatus Marinamargulisbacteria bacterium]
MKHIAIIGAGLAGLACAHGCTLKGHQVTLFDKSRGASGRTTTKRWPESSGIDMGAPYIYLDQLSSVTASIVRFLKDQGVIAPWDYVTRSNGQYKTTRVHVGVPKMSQLARALCADISLVPQQRIQRISQMGNHFKLFSESQSFDGFDQVVFAIPSPQLRLIQGLPQDLYDSAKAVDYDPVITLLFASRKPLWTDNVDEDHVDNGLIDYVVADSRKPGRKTVHDTYAVHSNRDWAMNAIDSLDKDTLQTTLMTSLQTHYGLDSTDRGHALMHAWRYAHVQSKAPRMKDGYASSITVPGVHACGDWCHGGGIESALESGACLANNKL